MNIAKYCLFTLLVALGTVVHAEEVTVGVKAPPINSVNQIGKPWALEDHLGDKYLVVYFYPAALTAGCTKQACNYRDYLKKNIVNRTFNVVGISADSLENIKYFRQAEKLNFTLLSDPDGKIAKDYGVPVTPGERSIKRTVGSKEVFLNRTSTIARWTFIIDPSGKIVYRDAKAKPVKDLKNVLTFLEQSAK